MSVVYGLIIASVPYFGTKYAEGISDASSGKTIEAHQIPGVLEIRRYEAMQRLETKADALGADAVLSVKFDIREINATWKEICIYGTAVRLRKE